MSITVETPTEQDTFVFALELIAEDEVGLLHVGQSEFFSFEEDALEEVAYFSRCESVADLITVGKTKRNVLPIGDIEAERELPLVAWRVVRYFVENVGQDNESVGDLDDSYAGIDGFFLAHRNSTWPKLIESAKSHLDGYGLPLEKYVGSVHHIDFGVVAEVHFTHVETEAVIVISDIYYSETGEVLQAGSNYGNLTL